MTLCVCQEYAVIHGDLFRENIFCCHGISSQYFRRDALLHPRLCESSDAGHG